MAPADGGRGCSAVNRPFKPPTFGYGVGREIVRVARFTVVGGVATMVHAGIYLLLVAGELTAPAPANLAGFVVAFGLSFAGQYGWTFRDRTRGHSGRGQRTAALRFTGVAALGFLMNAGFVAAVEATPGVNPAFAVVFIVGVTPVALFLLSKHWAFAGGAPPVSSDARARPAAVGRGRGWREGWAIPAAAILAAAPILANSVLWGAPQGLDPDEGIFVGKSLRMLADFNPDPGWYGAPAQPLLYALAGVYAAYIVILDQIGAIGSLQEAGGLYFEDRTAFLALGRLVSTLSATACLFVIVAILREVRTRLAAILFAILLFSVSPLILGSSSIVRMDFQQILFNLLTSYFCLLAMTRGGETRNLLLAGASVGVAVTSKYTGVVAAGAVVVTALWLISNGRMRPSKGLALLIGSGLASLAAAFVTGPYLFLSFAEVLSDVAKEARPTHLGATSQGFLSSLAYYATEAAPAALGWGGLLASVAGATLCWRRPLGIATLPFVVAYLVLVSSLNLVWYRWFLPVVPFAALFLGVAVDRALARLDGWRGIAAVLAAGLLVAPTIVNGVDLARSRAFDLDTRVQALAWVERALPRNSRLLVETGAPGVSARDFEVLVVHEGEGRIVPWRDLEEHVRVTGWFGHFGHWGGNASEFVGEIRRKGVKFVLMSDWADSFGREAAAYPKEVSVYRALLREFRVLREFLPAEGMSGQRIRILAVD